MSAITIDPAELKALIRSVVDEAVEERLAQLQSDWDDEVTDQALARAMEEARNDPTIPGEQFLAELKARL
jgi:hypothetical protein